jgi:hypothetical protein
VLHLIVGEQDSSRRRLGDHHAGRHLAQHRLDAHTLGLQLPGKLGELVGAKPKLRIDEGQALLGLVQTGDVLEGRDRAE